MAATTTTLPAPFTWAGDHVAIELPHDVHVLFTTRRGGVSAPPFDTLNLGRWTEDDPDAVEENRARALALTGAERFAFGRQVHGTTVVRDGAEVVEADGQVATRPGVATMALTADCMPIALAAPGAVGMVHAGWRGLAGGIVEEGVRAARGVAAAAIGPCARGCCYEVGDEVREALGLEPAGGPALVDLPALAAERLRAAGVGQVHDCGLCTMCSDPSLFFSHRRDGGRTGRQAGIAWR
jgi:purine-nucleoside/S-methyl-5'-thioadenosine phosphorylase / adenosine deaminase